MILTGDEVRRTQQGNNNAYCQDNEISWFDWRMAEENADLLRFWRLMIAFRKRCPLLRRETFELHGEGGFHINWHGVKRMTPDWGHESRTVAMQLTQLQDDEPRQDLHFIANSYWDDLDFELPQIGEQGCFGWWTPHWHPHRTSPRKARNFRCSRRKAIASRRTASPSSWRSKGPVVSRQRELLS